MTRGFAEAERKGVLRSGEEEINPEEVSPLTSANAPSTVNNGLLRSAEEAINSVEASLFTSTNASCAVSLLAMLNSFLMNK